MNISLVLAESGRVATYIESMPSWQKEVLLVLGILLALFLVIYGTIKYLLYRYRKAYNLTKVEHAKPDRKKKPAFLEVDHEAREEAIKRGDDYVRPADREVPDEVRKKAKRMSGWALACGIAAVIAAVGHAGILVVAILDHAKDADTVWQEFKTSEKIAAVLQKYWLGFTLAGLVLAAQVVRFVAKRKVED